MPKKDKKYLISLKFKENGSYTMSRYNKNFNALELLGILEQIQQEILLHISGEIRSKVTTLKRSVLESEDTE